jgi:DsbC/DsbD-like thiol-disulfide interchange protein
LRNEIKLTKTGFAYDLRKRDGRVMIKTTFALSAFFITALCACSAFAAAGPWQDIAGGRVRIVVAEPLPGDLKFRGMLQVDLLPGWKTYWRDPGDAGVPVQIDVSASKNAALSDIEFPAPMRFDDGVTVWAGYHAPVTFGLDFSRVDARAPVQLTGNAFLGVCDKICVPVRIDFDLAVEESAKPTMHQELVAMAYQALPLAASPGFGVTSLKLGTDAATITVAVSKAESSPELFLAPPQGLQFSAPVMMSTDGSIAVFEAKIISKSVDYVPQPVAFTLVNGQTAASGTIVPSAN